MDNGDILKCFFPFVYMLIPNKVLLKKIWNSLLIYTHLKQHFMSLPTHNHQKHDFKQQIFRFKQFGLFAQPKFFKTQI